MTKGTVKGGGNVSPPGRRAGARYSSCGLYRYRLWRSWSGGSGVLTWIMLNPSTADHLGNNDPTIERCERRARLWGFTRVEIVNLFALRSPDPRALKLAADPIGPENDGAILEAIAGAGLILCGWGALGSRGGRDAAVLRLLEDRPLACLGRTRAGAPVHPLYIPYDRIPTTYCAAGPARS